MQLVFQPVLHVLARNARLFNTVSPLKQYYLFNCNLCLILFLTIVTSGTLQYRNLSTNLLQTYRPLKDTPFICVIEVTSCNFTSQW